MSENGLLERARRLAFLACCIAALCGCSSDDEGDEPAGSGGKSGAGSSGSGGGGAFNPDNPGGMGGGGGLAGDAGDLDVDGSVDACATISADAMLEPLHLAFAFDVSGSMGKGDEPWHDKELKWDPVVAATRGFFEDEDSEGLRASLTFFPQDGDEDERCEAGSYEAPDVEMSALPSDAFGEAIAAIEAEDWRGGTPTRFVVEGTLAFIAASREAEGGRYALVLVTDGYPQGCDDEDDTLEAVATPLQAAHDDDGVETYVIGVANPPIDDAPDTVSNLHTLAEAGGTEQAFLIDTGDPTATSQAFEEAVSAIRGAVIACELEIPAPPDGRAFDKERVLVGYDDGATEHSLQYDPDCDAVRAWRYDDPASPARIELCASTCDEVRTAPEAALRINFACEQTLTVD
jgi:hypothetical protein